MYIYIYVCIYIYGVSLTALHEPNPCLSCRSWLQHILKRKLVDFAWNRRFFLFTRRVLPFLGSQPSKKFQSTRFFYPERLF